MDYRIIREKKAKRFYRGMLAFYCLFNVALLVFYAVKHDDYHFRVSLGTFAIPLLLELAWKLPFLRRVWQVDCLILGFAFIAYPLGSCLDLYLLLPGFDKVAHALSGTFVSLLALILYYALKPGHRIERRDAALVTAFMFFTSMAVAGLWEICEYLLSGIVGRDLQRVALTGVTDSMQDMIVCLVGTVVAIPVALRLCAGKAGVLSNAVMDAIALNFPSADEKQPTSPYNQRQTHDENMV